MKLTETEQKICDKYGQIGTDSKVHCSECPLVIDTRFCLCKANCTEEEWKEWKEQ